MNIDCRTKYIGRSTPPLQVRGAAEDLTGGPPVGGLILLLAKVSNQGPHTNDFLIPDLRIIPHIWNWLQPIPHIWNWLQPISHIWNWLQSQDVSSLTFYQAYLCRPLICTVTVSVVRYQWYFLLLQPSLLWYSTFLAPHETPSAYLVFNF